MLKFWITNTFFIAGYVLLFYYHDQYDISYWWGLPWMLLYSLIYFAGSYFIGLNYHVKSLNRLRTKEKKIVLTFDDGPLPESERVVEMLNKHGVKAVFFLIGKNIEGREHFMQQLKEHGHQMGNHSFSHRVAFDFWPSAQVEADIVQCQQLLEKYCDTKFFRPPFGVTNPKIRRAINRLGLRSIGWNVRSYDTSIRDLDKLQQRILKQLKPGAIILLHDRLTYMPELLDQLIPEIRRRGYSFSLLDK